MSPRAVCFWGATVLGRGCQGQTAFGSIAMISAVRQVDQSVQGQTNVCVVQPRFLAADLPGASE